MSVHSLIDKFQGVSGSKVKPIGKKRSSEGPQGPQSQIPQISQISPQISIPGQPQAPQQGQQLPQGQLPQQSQGPRQFQGPPGQAPQQSQQNLQVPQISGRQGQSPAPGQTPGQPQGAIPDTGPLSLLGPNVLSFPLSENAYIEALKLKAEQERTKQEFYRLEIVLKNWNIFQNALRAQVPAHLIPMMCVGGLPLEPGQVPQGIPGQQQHIQQPQQPGQSVQRQQGQPQQPQTQQPQPQPQQVTPQQGQQTPQQGQVHPGQLQQVQPSPSSEFQKGHLRSNSRYLVDFNANPVPALNYRFGSSGSTTSPVMTPVRRPLSPAKIGAAAVANLSTPITPYRATGGPVMSNTSNTRRLLRYQHQRHYLMPVESPNRVNLGRIDQHQQKVKHSQQASGGYILPAASKSPLTTTMQVKPLPAQPLHKQGKSAQPPSQELMTSFQHIIQFHHWKPESGGPPPVAGPNPFRHKRQKSDNMSIDLGSPTRRPDTMVTSTPLQPKEMENDPIDDRKDETMDMDEDNTTISDNVSRIIPVEAPDVSVVERGGAITETEETDIESEQSEPADPAAAASTSAPRGHRRGLLNVGRYPHDILSPYTK